MRKKLLAIVLAVGAMVSMIAAASPAMAQISAEDSTARVATNVAEANAEAEPATDTEPSTGPEYNILKPDAEGEGAIWWLLGLVVKILIYGLGAAAVLGVMVAGIMYLSARDNPQQVAKARTRLIEVAIGLLAWALAFTVVNWLVPGGVNNLGSSGAGSNAQPAEGDDDEASAEQPNQSNN